MNARHLLAVSVMTLLLVPFSLSAQAHDASVGNHELHLFAAADFGINPENVTFSRDIAPILQRSCENCHRAGGGAPMALTTYQEVRRWSQRIKLRTAIRDRMGAMPPFFVEKEIGIHQFKDDQSLNDEELALGWTIGEPDLVLRSIAMIVPAVGPDRWGDIGLVPTGLTVDRYVQAVEVREINDIPSKPRAVRWVAVTYSTT